MPNFQTLKLTWYTVRHMTPRQWAYRFYYILKGKLPSPALKTPEITGGYPIMAAYTNSQKADIEAADRLLRNEFPTVGQQTVRFEDAIDWDMRQNTYRLACFNLNSFSWLLTLSDAFAETEDRRYLDKGFSLIRQWQHDCGKRVRGDKWNAYVLSKRLMHQIGFLSRYAGSRLSEFVPFLAAQTRILSNNVEFHLGANHVLREAAVLMFCGAFLQDQRLYRRGKRILFSEFEEQFLPDGGHYERSVSYHVESLQQCFEALWLMYRLDDPDAEGFCQKLQTPYIYLNAMLRCDGTIPLVNDAAVDYPFDAADFLNTASWLYTEAPPKGVPGPYSRRWMLKMKKLPISWEAPTLFAQTGFWSHHFEFDGTRHSLFLDAGNNGPDYNLGHTHADSLNFLWTTGDGEIFADSGVYTYFPGSQRNACRATAAHNTVEIDGVSSSQVWSAFRTAKRAHTRVEVCKETEDVLSLTASHDGYCKVLSDPVTHRRQLSLDQRSGLLTVSDTLLPKKESHEGVLRFHLAPDCAAVTVGDRSVLLKGKYLLSCSEEINLEPCFVAKEFGVQQESLCITVKFPIRGKTAVHTTVSLLPV